MIVIPHNVELCKQYFMQEFLLLIRTLQLIFSNYFHGKRPLWELELVKREKTSISIVNKQLSEAEVKFLIEHDKKELKWCIITLYIEETPHTNISDTSNEHNCFYILGKAKTYLNFTSI